MITELINKVNEKLKSNLDLFPCLQCYKLYGLAEQVVLRDSDSERWMPYVIDRNGEDTDVWVDDDISIGIYHRLISKSYSKADLQIGREILQEATAEMLLVCWAFRKYLNSKSTVETLERLIYSSLYANNGNTIAVNSNFDRKSVFNAEFSGVPFNLPEDVLLFSMRYRFYYPINKKDCEMIPNICKDC